MNGRYNRLENDWHNEMGRQMSPTIRGFRDLEIIEIVVAFYRRRKFCSPRHELDSLRTNSTPEAGRCRRAAALTLIASSVRPARNAVAEYGWMTEVLVVKTLGTARSHPNNGLAPECAKLVMAYLGQFIKIFIRKMFTRRLPLLFPRCRTDTAVGEEPRKTGNA